MSNERDELADELSGHPIGSGYYSTNVGMDEAREMADVIIAEGYRKPRTITTIGNLGLESEGTVILTAHGSVLQHRSDYWTSPGRMTEYTPIVDWLPATVLHEPGA